MGTAEGLIDTSVVVGLPGVSRTRLLGLSGSLTGMLETGQDFPRSLIPETGMMPAPIIEHLDVSRDGLLRLVTRRVMTTVN